MIEPSAHSLLWIRRYHPASRCSARLVCLPHAGGSATFFLPLAKALSPAIEVLAVQYPGRQDRHAEPAIETVPGLVGHVFAALQPFGDRPLALFGHSMGAVLAFELALRLQDAGPAAPVRLFASGRRAPSRCRDDRIYPRTDAEIVAELRALSGTNAAMLADPEILDMFMPALRSDYRAIETYRHDTGRKVTCPVTVLTGNSDPHVSLDEAQAWQEHTTGPTEVHVFPGGHFFLAERSAAVTALVSQRLRRIDAEPGGRLN